MGLKGILEKMKLVEEEETGAPRPPARPGTPPAPGGPAPRATIGDVLLKVPPPARLDERALPAGAGDEIPDFEAIYTASGVKDPAHGFGAYKVLEILSAADFASLDPRAKAAALSGFLRMNPAGPVAIADVIKDAVARDQALDNFEQFLRKKLDARREQLDKENVGLQAEIDELTRRHQQKMESNRQALEQEKRRFAEWQARKRIEERKLFDAVGPFVEPNPVTLGSGPDAAPGGGPSKD